MTLEELHVLVRRGVLAQQFINSEFWKSHWEPEWKNIAKRYADSLWQPEDRRTTEQVALESAFQSGAFKEMQTQLEILNSWIQAGERARLEIERLEAREEKRAKFREFLGAI